MRRYNAILKHDLAGDGRVYKAGSVVGTVESTMPITNLISALFFSDVTLEADPTQEPPEQVRNVRREQPVATLPEPQPAEVDPDALNAADVDDEEPTPPTQVETVATEPELPPELQALPHRIAGALVDHEFTTRAEVQTYLDEGGLLSDVAGIGKAAERKILEWLKS